MSTTAHRLKLFVSVTRHFWKLSLVIITSASLLSVVVLLIVLEPSLAANYPTTQAARMPAAVKTPLPELLARLEAVLKARAPAVLESLQPGLTAEQITAIEKKAGLALTEDLRLLYQWRNGSLQGGAEFIPGHRFVPLEQAIANRQAILDQLATLPAIQRKSFDTLVGFTRNWLAIFPDPAGDGYHYDLSRSKGEGSFFYSFLETNDFVFFPRVGNFITGVLDCWERELFRPGKDAGVEGDHAKFLPVLHNPGGRANVP